MRNLKKFLALVLAMMMALSLMVTANAANDKNARDIYPDGGNITEQFKEAVDVLYGMGIMTGDNGTFYGDRPVMRAEMATVLYRLMTGDTKQLKNQLYADIAAERFDDIDSADWFAPYVGWCYDAGIMVGSNGLFRPGANVTGYETLVMVLRAMGYGKNGEYTGIGWNVNASSDGTVVGLLKDVNNTSYANTLSANTRREVVASIVFQGAKLPVVTYTPSLGYNKYIGVALATGGNQLNPSLGETYFGLTCAYGIVVGNQASGEDYTKVGFIGTPGKGTVNYTNGEQDLRGRSAYYYNNNAMVSAASGTPGDPAYVPAVYAGNAVRNFAWTTDLTMFNHAVKVWFNYNNTKTYALYDEVKATVIVTTAEATADNLTVTALAAIADGNADSGNNWNKTAVYDGTNAFFNYSFAAMNSENYGTNAGKERTTAISGNTNEISAVSPIKKNNDSTGSGQGLYLLISNNNAKTIDVVISLDLTMTKVAQTNVTTKPLSVGVLANNQDATTKGSNNYFGVDSAFPGVSNGGDYGKLVNVTGSNTSYVSLLKDSLLNTTEAAQALHTKVAAIEITGTDGGVVAKAGENGCADNSNTNFDSTFYYQLTQPQWTKTVKVIKIDTANQDVYIEGGDVLHQSVFAEATDETFIKNDSANSNSGMEGFNATTGRIRLVAGKEYTFTLDAENGNYIYWETPSASANFVYGTYIDWETKTASSLFDYPLVYVNTAGKMDVTSITKLETNAMDIDRYAGIGLPKHDRATTGNNSGFVKGLYIGYALGSDGSLTAVTNIDDKDTGYKQADTTDFGTSRIDITPISVALGAEATNKAQLFLTENTQFYIVDGAGTENQKVTPYKGISELMKGMSKVEIHGESGYLTTTNEGKYLDSASLLMTGNPYQMFYYEEGPFQYHQNYDDSAREIRTIFLPKPCVKFFPTTSTSLVFIGNANATMVDSNNGTFATQFTTYDVNGVASDTWIDGDFADTTKDAYTVKTTNGNNVFYELTNSGKTASDGKPIYNIAPVQNPDTTVIGQYWDGSTKQMSNNVESNHGTAYVTGEYKATTFNEQAAYIQNALYNVGNAGIKNLKTTAYPGIVDNNLSSLNGAGSLATNNGVPVSCVLDGNDPLNLTVSQIFVNA